MDVALALNLIEKTLFELQVNTTTLRCAVALTVSGWAMAGCDFVSLRGLHADAAWDAASRVATKSPAILGAMEGVWSGSADAALGAVRACSALLEEVGSLKSQSKRGRCSAAAAATATSPTEEEVRTALRRAVWTVSYWCGCEFSDKIESKFGFERPGVCCSKDMLNSS